MQLLDLKKDIILIIEKIKKVGVPSSHEESWKIDGWKNEMLYYNSILGAYKVLIDVCKFQSDWFNDGDIGGGGI